ncbi:hypothetical protein CKO12_02105 [Chromatium okenii]|nr:hypothetical protein [Chromatium okenii]
MNMSLSAKLYSMAAIMAALVIVGAVSGYFGIKHSLDSFSNLMVKEEEQVRVALKAQVYYGMAVRAFKNYLIRKDAKYTQEFNQAAAAMKAELEAYARLADSQEEKNAINNASKTLTVFEQAFSEMSKQREINTDIPAIDKLFGRPAAPVYDAILVLDGIAKKDYELEYKRVEALALQTGVVLIVGGLLGIVLIIVSSHLIIRRILLAVQAVTAAAKRAAERDLTMKAEVFGSDAIAMMALDINKMMANLGIIIGKMNTTSVAVTQRSQAFSATVTNIRLKMNEQATKTAHVATSATEMSKSILDIARNTSNIAISATATLQTADEGKNAVGKTVAEVSEIAKTVMSLATLVHSLGDRSKQIGDIVNVIKNIAAQTNLLALNAAIEAARAGEQGRGFAVVADEVRELAEKTAHSTAQISAMIGAIQSETAEAVKTMEDGSKKVASGVELASLAGVALDHIHEKVATLQGMVQEIASATEEMSAVSSQISGDIKVIAAASQETSVSSVGIQDAALELNQLSLSMQNEANLFRI